MRAIRPTTVKERFLLQRDWSSCSASHGLSVLVLNVAPEPGLLGLAHSNGGDAPLLQAHHAAWVTAFSRGDLHSRRFHAREGIRLYDQHRHAFQSPVHKWTLCTPGVEQISHGKFATLGVRSQPRRNSAGKLGFPQSDLSSGSA
jgi:hypothetical protein